MKKLFWLAIIASIPIMMFSCDKDEEADPPVVALAIGDFHEGGIIFYLDTTGEHGLVCDIIDRGFDIEWGCPTASGFGAEGLEIGTGAQNTIDIVNRCNTPNIAATLCDELEQNGFDDWFLPSKDELDALYQHLEIVNEAALEQEGGGLLYNGEFYWSSSHEISNKVWVQYFRDGYQKSELKDDKNAVRAIRAF